MRHIAAFLKARTLEVATTVVIATLVILIGGLFEGHNPPSGPLSGTDWITTPLANAINDQHGTMFLAGAAAMLGLAGGLLVAWARFNIAATHVRRQR